jgi:CheY-like chemotaxis protein
MVKKVLLIDDDPVVLQVYAALFQQYGFETHFAEDAEAGFAKLSQSCPDAVLLDPSMRKVNGVDWLEAVQADERFSRIPVVLFRAGQIDPQHVVESVATAIAAAPESLS